MTNHLGLSQCEARQQLYKMMTVNSAKALGLEAKIGQIRQDGWADLFVLTHTQAIQPGDNGIDILFENNDSQTAGVYTGGMLVLADVNTFQPPEFGGDFIPLPADDGSAAASRYVNFHADGNFPQLDISTIASEIDTAFRDGGTAHTRTGPVVVPPGAFQRSKFLVSDAVPYQEFMASLDAWLAN